MNTFPVGLGFRILRTLWLVLIGFVPARADEPQRARIVSWDFNDPALFRASEGEGRLALLGGLVATNFLGAADDPGRPNGALSVRSFPPQGTAPQSAGIELETDVQGWRDLRLEFQIRASGTASRRIQVLVAAGDGAFTEAGFHQLIQDGVFETVSLDLPVLPESGRAGPVRIRLVSDFEDGAAYNGVKPRSDGGNSYSVSGTWRFDLLRLTGVREGASGSILGVRTFWVAGDFVLEWPSLDGATVTVWRSAGPEGPWDPVATGLESSSYAEVAGEDVGFFRVTSP